MGGPITYMQHAHCLATTAVDDEDTAGHQITMREHMKTDGKGEGRPTIEYSAVRRVEGKKVSVHIRK